MKGYNFLLENIVLPLGDALLGNSYIQQLRRWRKIQYLNATALRQLELQNLKKQLQFAVRQVPFYRHIQLNPSASPTEWLHSFPILTKQILNDQQNQLLTEPKHKLTKVASSGSSGLRSVVYLNNHDLSTTRAIQTLWWEWTGFRLGDRLLQTGINPNRTFVKKIKDKLTRTTYTSAFNHDEASISSILRKQYDYFGGYASSLNEFALIAEKYQIDAHFRAAFCWGDKVFDSYRAQVRRSFRCELFETYGASEGLMIAAQQDLPYLYIMNPHIHLEILDDDHQPVPDGQLGHVVATRLDSRAMPLIRYQLGDLAIKLPAELYPKDRKLQFPLLQKVIGRDTDVVKTRQGQVLVVHFFTGIFEHIPQIKQFRVIQESLDGMLIEYIPGKNFSVEILSTIEQQILKKIKEPFHLVFKKVENIPPTASGKPQMVLSLIQKK